MLLGAQNGTLDGTTRKFMKTRPVALNNDSDSSGGSVRRPARLRCPGA